MKLKALKDHYLHHLNTSKGAGEASALFHFLLQYRAGMSQLRYLQHAEEDLEPEVTDQLLRDLKGLLQNKPVQQLTGQAPFLDFSLQVSPEVLIPRPETEEIIQRIISLGRDSPPTSILDIGTGSGCMAIALARAFPEAQVLGLDKSSQALEVARANGAALAAQVNWLQADILDRSQVPHGPWDLIVSNPPYVRPSESAQMALEVTDYEPGLALFVEQDNPLLFYRVIADYAGEHLRRGGMLVLELNRYLAQSIHQLLPGGPEESWLERDSSEAWRMAFWKRA